MSILKKEAIPNRPITIYLSPNIQEDDIYIPEDQRSMVDIQHEDKKTCNTNPDMRRCHLFDN